jgi:hypothetical protein
VGGWLAVVGCHTSHTDRKEFGRSTEMDDGDSQLSDREQASGGLDRSQLSANSRIRWQLQLRGREARASFAPFVCVRRCEQQTYLNRDDCFEARIGGGQRKLGARQATEFSSQTGP